MLTRDFIDDSLYNPNYGYFSKQAVIFSPETDFDFTEMRDHMEFMNVLAQMYKELENDADEVDEVARQVWHTPTELFKVHAHSGSTRLSSTLTHFNSWYRASHGMDMRSPSTWYPNTSSTSSRTKT